MLGVCEVEEGGAGCGREGQEGGTVGGTAFVVVHLGGNVRLVVWSFRWEKGRKCAYLDESVAGHFQQLCFEILRCFCRD